MRIMREIRFSLGPTGSEDVPNSYAGWPSAAGVQPYLVLQAVVAGRPDPLTGYLVNITVIDQLLRERAIPLARRLCAGGPCSGERLIRSVADDLRDRPPAGTRWVAWQLKITPFVSYSIDMGAPHMLSLTTSFEFAAAHRLHCPEMSDEANRAYFGKCNNPSGHGHNYILEVSITAPGTGDAAGILPVVEFERIVRDRVISRFDHKHLNEDCPEFRSVNPSVENIVRTIWTLLDGRFPRARLSRVRVWETAKTWAEFDGQDD
jgi:6-pyruvoyltetrahydropterin/6-carboxytetrahydropterin synthase